MTRRNQALREPKAIARSEPRERLLLEALKQIGDLSAARRMCGLTAADLKVLLAQKPELQSQIDSAIEEGQGKQVDRAIKLMQSAQSVAMACQDWEGMVEIAQILAPELYVEPRERARARAKAEEGPKMATAIQVNLGMAELGDRLQDALKAKIQDSVVLPQEVSQNCTDLESVLLGEQITLQPITSYNHAHIK